MKRLALGSIFLLAGVLLLSGSPALADTIASVSNSNDGFGSSYTLTEDCNASQVCSVTLQIDSTTATKSDISNVDFKIGSSDLLTGTLTAPTASWSTVASSLSSGGCSGSNNDAQICSSATGDFADTGGLLTWTWTGVQVTGDLSIGHVGYKYDTSDTLGRGLIVSDDYCTSVPEPGSLGLLFIGLLGLAVAGKFAVANPLVKSTLP